MTGVEVVEVEPLFSPKSLAEYLGMSERYVRGLLAEPDPAIPSLKIGEARRIRPEAVRAYLDGLDS